MDPKNQRPDPYTTETVWDGGECATGQSSDGQMLRVGYQDGWPPEQLILFAAESCFMNRFLAAARGEGVQVLGYVSSGHLETEHTHEPPSITLRPCVVVKSDREADAVGRIATAALADSVVGRLFGGRVRVALDVQRETAPGRRVSTPRNK